MLSPGRLSPGQLSPERFCRTFASAWKHGRRGPLLFFLALFLLSTSLTALLAAEPTASKERPTAPDADTAGIDASQASEPDLELLRYRYGYQRGKSEQMLDTDRPNTFEREYVRPLHYFFTPESLKTTPRRDVGSLTLPDALRYALRSNLDLQVQESQVDIEETRVKQAQAAFDPVVETSSRWQDNRYPQNTREFLATGGSGEQDAPRIFEEIKYIVESSIKGKIPFGTEYDLSARLTSQEDTTTRTSASSLFSPEYSSGVDLSLTQPFLQGFSTDVQMAPIRIERRNRQIAEEELKATVQEIASQVVTTYFDFVHAFEELKLRQAQVRVFNLIERNTSRQLEQGEITRRQLLTIKAQRLESQEKAMLAEEKLESARSDLFQLFGSGFTETNNFAFHPVGRFTPKELDYGAERLLQAAQENPRVRQIKIEIERNDLELFVARDEAQPQLNLVTSVGVRGLGRSVGPSYSSIVDDETHVAEVGVVLSFPWSNDRAKARIREVQELKHQNQLRYDRQRQLATAKVRQLRQTLQSRRERFENAKSLREVMSEEVDQEQLELEKGNKPFYETLQFYRELYDMRALEISILRDMNKTKVELLHVSGLLPKHLGISVRQ